MPVSAQKPENTAKDQREIPTLVKDASLVEEKRRTIVQAAVGLFVKKGYHQTTTREIARAAGFSIGSLYEYVQSKEDVLYLVCDSIHGEMEQRMRAAIGQGGSARKALEQAMQSYFEVCDEMQDSILLIYRETASLAGESQRYVLQNEERVTGLFAEILERGIDEGVFFFRDRKTIGLMAHNVVVLGHMWAFRRWYLRETFTLGEYTRQQTSLVLSELLEGIKKEPLI